MTVCLSVPVHCTHVFVCVCIGNTRSDLLLAGAGSCSNLTSTGLPDVATAKVE